MFFGVAAIVWVLTLTQLGGTKYTARISKVGFVGGIIVPVIVLLVGLVAYFATGGVSQITMDAATFVPDFGKVDTLVIFASFILAYMGVEASASHVNELKNPNRNYPLAMIVPGHPHHRARRAGRPGRGHDACRRRVLDGNLSFGVIEAFRRHLRAAHSARVWAGSCSPWRCCWRWACSPRSRHGSWARRAPCSTRRTTASSRRRSTRSTSTACRVQTVVIQAVIVTVWDAVLCGSIALSGGSSSSVGYLTAIGLTVVIYLVGYVLFFLGILRADLPARSTCSVRSSCRAARRSRPSWPESA